MREIKDHSFNYTIYLIYPRHLRVLLLIEKKLHIKVNKEIDMLKRQRYDFIKMNIFVEL